MYLRCDVLHATLYDDLAQKQISCCGTVRLHWKGMPKDLKPKTLRLKCVNIWVKTRGWLDGCGVEGQQRQCRMCWARGVTRTVMLKCIRCDTALCVDRWSLNHNVSKRTWIFIFKAYWAMSVSFPTNCFLFHKFIPLSSQNIQDFRKACTKFKYPTE
jgi:hypothetical protein